MESITNKKDGDQIKVRLVGWKVEMEMDMWAYGGCQEKGKKTLCGDSGRECKWKWCGPTNPLKVLHCASGPSLLLCASLYHLASLVPRRGVWRRESWRLGAEKGRLASGWGKVWRKQEKGTGYGGFQRRETENGVSEMSPACLCGSPICITCLWHCCDFPLLQNHAVHK